MEIDSRHEVVEDIDPNHEVVEDSAPEIDPLAVELVEFLQGNVTDPITNESFGLEGRRSVTYNPGGKSGITIGTGVDLKHHTESSMVKAGLPTEIAQKLSEYYGKDDSALVGKTPLSEEEIDLLDLVVMTEELKHIRKKIKNFDDVPKELRQAVIMAEHQYGSGTNLVKQVAAGKYKEAVENLTTWTDKTPDLGENIAKKYHAIGRAAKEVTEYANMEDGWYRDKSTKAEFEVKNGRRVM